MITKLSFKNFKGWKEVTGLRFAPITGFFGANSSGKTSILQLLLMLKQTVESTDRMQVLDFGNEKSPANLGGFKDVIHGHSDPQKISWDIRWKIPDPIKIMDPEEKTRMLFSGSDLGFKAEIAANEAGKLSVESMNYCYANHEFIMNKKTLKGDKYNLSVNPSDSFRFKRNQGRVWDPPKPIKCYGFPNEVNAYFQNAGFLSDLQLAFENLFGGIKYLGPLREYPRREYPWSGGEPVDMGMRGERVIEAILAAQEKEMMINRGRGKKRISLEARVAEWLRELNLIYSFRIEPLANGGSIYRVNVRKNHNSPEVMITDVGFGVSQILPAIVLCYYAPEGSIIVLEQPEIHLHPAVQAGLADVFIDAVKTRGVQVIFESHSEHLLKRIQRRIAEEFICCDDTALYFSESLNGASKLTPLDIDLFGTIKNWPRDFFGDQFGEIAATTKAAIKRKAAEKK